MPRIKPDYEPSQHAYGLLIKRINKAEAIAGISESRRLTESQIKVMSERETEKMVLYFLTHKKNGKLVSRESWELTWVNWMDRYYENNRHNRSYQGGESPNAFQQAYGQLINAEAPMVPRKPVKTVINKAAQEIEEAAKTTMSKSEFLDQLKRISK